MENILYQIKDFAIGLNCGIWDYSASIINKFGKRKNFIIPGIVFETYNFK
jgi:malate synthase